MKIILEEDANVDGVVLAKVATSLSPLATVCFLFLFISSLEVTNFLNIQDYVRVYIMKNLECKNARDLLLKA